MQEGVIANCPLLVGPWLLGIALGFCEPFLVMKVAPVPPVAPVPWFVWPVFAVQGIVSARLAPVLCGQALG